MTFKNQKLKNKFKERTSVMNTYLHKEDIKKTNKHMKRCLKSLAI